MIEADSATIGHGIAALAHAGCFAYLLRSARRHGALDAGIRRLLAAVGASAAWSAAMLAERIVGSPMAAVAYLLDLARYALWFAFVVGLIRPPAAASGEGNAGVSRFRWDALAFGVVAANLAAGVVAGAGSELTQGDLRLVTGAALALAICGLVLIEQLFRNQSDESRWNAKPVCLALACVFGYDLYLYADALMFGRMDADALDARGAVHALATPLLFIAARRHRGWVGKLKVSREAAFYSAALLLAGGYLVFMAIVGYYVRFFGGNWGRALQVAVVFGALIAGTGFVLSASARARLRVFLSKNFFSYRYDYRQEWLHFTDKLSSTGSPQEVGLQVVQALANLIECPAGSLWTRGLDGQAFVQTAHWNAPRNGEAEPVDSEFCRFLRERDWIVDLVEYRDSPRQYQHVMLPRWLMVDPQAWLVIPLRVGDEMTGYVQLQKPRTPIELNWEVRDLLKTASRQAAGYLARLQATEQLLEARKFDAFNRMSAFVVHDLKNIITQLSLMLKNAERHRDNPEFQQDMMLTVESSLEKMRQMMMQLREGNRPVGSSAGIDLAPLLERLRGQAAQRGRELQVRVVDRIATRGDEQRMERVLGHLVQNALDATPASGRVWVSLRQLSGRAELVIGDTGHGMTPEFIANRLFRPFNTTKTSGMGIGAYESFQYIKELGGSIDVRSEPDKGCEITLLLPIFDSQRATDLQQMSTEP